LRSQENAKGQTLIIAGPYEFISDDGKDHALPEAFVPLVKAYEALGYDAGAVSPAEAAKFSSLKTAAPKGWQVLDQKEPKTVILDSPKGKVGVVFFPEAKKPGDDPSPQTVQAINRVIKDLRPQVKLVVGVSPWGVQTESDFLEKSKPDLDVLLGSGGGVGFSAKPSEGGKTLWMHTYSKGKAIYTVDVLAWPSGKEFKWESGTNYATQALVLDDTFTPDSGIEQQLQNVPDPGDKQAK
jgi:hypothetical protein